MRPPTTPASKDTYKLKFAKIIFLNINYLTFSACSGVRENQPVLAKLSREIQLRQINLK